MNGMLLDLLLLSAKSAPFILMGCGALWILRRFVLATERRILSTEDLDSLRERCAILEHEVDAANSTVAQLNESHRFLMQLLADRSEAVPRAVSAVTLSDHVRDGHG